MRRRALYTGLFAVFAIGVASAVYLAFSLDAQVARAIEREGSRMVGAPVHVGSVDIQLSKGVGSIKKLRVDNPDGFGRGQALELEEIVLDLKPMSLREPPVRLSHVEVGETSVYLELDEQGRSNLDQLLRHARQTSAHENGAGSREPRRIAIDRLDFAGGTVLLDRPGAGETARLDLPGFDREGVGGSQGATGGEIAKLVTQSLARQVAVATAAAETRSAVGDEFGGAAGEAAGDLVEGLFGN